MKIDFEAYDIHDQVAMPQYYAAHMVKSMKIKCYRNHKSKQCLEIHEVLLPWIVFA